VTTGSGDFVISDAYSVPSPNSGIYMTPNGTNVALCPGGDFGCAPPATFNAQSAWFLKTQGVANQQESGLFVLVDSSTGEDTLWLPNTGYVLGVFVEANGNLYNCTTAGHSAVSGTGPSGTGTGIADGTCVWNYGGPSYANGKNGVAVSMIMRPGSGQAFALPVSLQLEPGWKGRFGCAMELDTANFSGNDTQLGSATIIYDLYLSGSVGSEPITAYLAIGPGAIVAGSGGTFAGYYGIYIGGNNAYKNSEIALHGTGSQAGYFDGGAHAVAGINEGSTSPTGLLLTGTYSGNAIYACSGKFILAPSGLLGLGNGMSVAIPASGVLETFLSGATVTGNISTNGTTTSYNTSSDYRLKTLSSATADGALIDRLQVHMGTFKAEPGAAPRSMLIAHEVQQHMPQVVQGKKDAVDEDGKPVMQMIDHSALIPELIAKCQALSREVAELRAAIGRGV
jgi:hypothetical protein